MGAAKPAWLISEPRTRRCENQPPPPLHVMSASRFGLWQQSQQPHQVLGLLTLDFHCPALLPQTSWELGGFPSLAGRCEPPHLCCGDTVFASSLVLLCPLRAERSSRRLRCSHPLDPSQGAGNAEPMSRGTCCSARLSWLLARLTSRPEIVGELTLPWLPWGILPPPASSSGSSPSITRRSFPG